MNRKAKLRWLKQTPHQNLLNNTNNESAKVFIMKENAKLTLSKKVISSLENDRMRGVVGGEAPGVTFENGCTRGCTDGCGPLQTAWHCTRGLCTNDCTSSMTCNDPIHTVVE